MADDKALESLADAVLDGAAVDWAAAEARADAAQQPLVRGLQVVASVARLHRDVLPDTGEHDEEWGHLRLLERVGRGACGEVFRAWDTRLDREVALKLLPAAPVSGASETAGGVSSLTVGDAQSIIREGQLLAKVRHPNVVTIHGAAQIDDCVGLWMEFIHGRTLEALLQQGAAFEPDEVMHIGVEVCRAVSAVHAAGLLHRDIKAHNVMRADDGRVVLMDFGAGRELADGAQGELAGTPLYLAPELLRQEPATVRSDVYSLGVLLYRLVSGAYPVRGDSIAALRSAHQRGDRVSLRAASPATGVRLARIIERAIDPKPERRFGTAAALGAALLGLQRYERRKPLLYGAAAAMVVALTAVAAWGRFTSSTPEPPRPTVARSDIVLPAPPVVPPDQPAAEAPPPKPAPARVRPAGVRPSVQVMPLVNATGRVTDAWLSAALAEMLLREFRGSEAFRWIPGDVPLAKAQFGLAMGYTSSMVLRPVIPADVIVSGEYRVSSPPSGGPLAGLAVTLKIEDVGAGLAGATLAEKGTVEELVELVGRLGARARASVGAAPLTPQQSAALAASQPANTAAARAYAEGLAKVAPDALEAAEEAIVRDRRFAPAYILLAEASYFRRGPPCSGSSPPECGRNREQWEQKMADAAAKARELSAALPREERMVIEVRARMVEGGRVFEPDYARISRQLFDLFPDTVTYGYWVARAQQREKDVQGALATIDAISRLPEGRQDLLVLDLEALLARGTRDFKRAARALEQSWALAAPAGDPGFRAGIRADQAFVARELEELHKARAFGEEAARLYTAAGNEVGLQQVRATLASIYRELGDFARARTTYEQRIAFENSRSPLGPTERNIRYNLAIELFHHGDLADARTEFEQVIRETGSKPLPYVACAKIRLGVVLHRLGDLVAARTLVDEVLTANPKDRSQCQGESARVFFEQGELDRARALSNELGVLTGIALAAGDPDAARAMVQETLPIPTAQRRVFLSDAFLTGAFEIGMVQARIALEEGRASDARREAEQAVKLAREDFRPDDEASAESVLALSWLAEGRLREAQQTIARLEKRLTITEDRLLRLSAGVTVARVQAGSGVPIEITLARQRLEALIREAADLGAVAIAFEARLALGEIEMRAGDTGAGRATLAALEREAAAKGFVSVARRAAAARR